MITLPPLASLTEQRVNVMRDAAVMVVETAESLAERGANAVSEALRDGEEFAEWNHYPAGDVLDKSTGAQYYYHSHNGAADEHGHFHTFLRYQGIPDDISPVPHEGQNAKDWPDGKETITHLIAISMDHHGLPTHLFTTNRWVTAETVFAAEHAPVLLDNFAIAEDIGDRPETNRWITGMVALFRPQIEQLLVLRDEALAARAAATVDKDEDVYEDHGVEITSICEISIYDQLEWLELLE
ncbi:MAG: DUF6969 family protein [Alphaproteobacteria bacterium]